VESKLLPSNLQPAFVNQLHQQTVAATFGAGIIAAASMRLGLAGNWIGYTAGGGSGSSSSSKGIPHLLIRRRQ